MAYPTIKRLLLHTYCPVNLKNLFECYKILRLRGLQNTESVAFLNCVDCDFVFRDSRVATTSFSQRQVQWPVGKGPEARVRHRGMGRHVQVRGGALQDPAGAAGMCRALRWWSPLGGGTRGGTTRAKTPRTPTETHPELPKHPKNHTECLEHLANHDS